MRANDLYIDVPRSQKHISEYYNIVQTIYGKISYIICIIGKSAHSFDKKGSYHERYNRHVSIIEADNSTKT